MAALMPESEVILRQADMFSDKVVLFAGAVRDTLPELLNCKQCYVHTSYFDYYQSMQPRLQQHIEYAVLPSAELVARCDCVIFYWPKNKAEATFQLESILSQLALQTPCYIVGENRSGVRSVEKRFIAAGNLNKIDSARRCSCYFLDYTAKVAFDLASWWQNYQVAGATVMSLPGVFSADRLDEGSALLLKVLLEHYPNDYQGKVLDIGCGAGVLGSRLLLQNPKMQLTMSDIHASAIAASEATLTQNGQTATVIASHLFSTITGVFDVIVSNPPFHEGLQFNLKVAERLFIESLQHLATHGRFYIVANSFLPYPEILQSHFGSYEVVASNNKFKVYRVSKPSRQRHLK